MKAAKAIEILTECRRYDFYIFRPDLNDAIKLGIEALIRIQNYRAHPSAPVYGPLPGEDDWRD